MIFKTIFYLSALITVEILSQKNIFLKKIYLVRCAAHCINLAVKEGEKKFLMKTLLLKKIRNIFSSIRRSPKI